MYDESSLLPISGLQHLAFCERQWALIHLEQSWADNQLTAEGRVLHKNVDRSNYETRKGMRLVRGLPLRSLRLGLVGRADLVEFPTEGGPPVTVEYKRGKPKYTDVDEIQLCAQALCLEEMLTTDIESGLLYYFETKHRHLVMFSAALRERVETLCQKMHNMHATRATPQAHREKKCTRCSLLDLCRPEWLDSDPWARWNARAMEHRS